MSVPFNYMNSIFPPRPGMPGATPGTAPGQPGAQPPQPGMMSPGMTAGTTQGPQQPGQIDPALYAQLLGTQGDLRELEDLDKQLAQAQALRDTAMPEGRSTGRIYTAANPLEHIGALMRVARGAKEEREIEEGVRNPGYAPGVTKEAQPEWKREGRRTIKDRVKSSETKVGEEWAKGRDIVKGY